MDALIIVDPASYKTPFEAYPTEALTFSEKHGIELPSLATIRGQALALMTQPEIRGARYVTRAVAEAFFLNIGMATGDAIQAFNKATGFKRIAGRGKYCVCYPFVPDMTDIHKRKGAALSGDRDAAIEAVKEWHRANIVDVPNHLWQCGHLDPTVPDASEANLAWQPPIQGKYRDRFKFDPEFNMKWPTAKELIRNLNRYYTKEEQALLREALGVGPS